MKSVIIMAMLVGSALCQTNDALTTEQYTRIRPFPDTGLYPSLSASEAAMKYSGIRIAFTNDNEIPRYTLSPYSSDLAIKKSKTVAIANVRVNKGAGLYSWQVFKYRTDGGDMQDYVPKSMNLEILYMDTTAVANIEVVRVLDKKNNAAEGQGIRIVPANNALVGITQSSLSFLQYFPVSVKLVPRLQYGGQIVSGARSKSTERDEFYIVEYEFSPVAGTKYYDTFLLAAANYIPEDKVYFSLVINAYNDGAVGIR